MKKETRKIKQKLEFTSFGKKVINKVFKRVNSLISKNNYDLSSEEIEAVVLFLTINNIKDTKEIDRFLSVFIVDNVMKDKIVKNHRKIGANK
jgi:hypothetical protein